MEQHLSHPQKLGKRTGVLPAGAAKTAQHGLAQVVPALNRHPADRFSHAFEGHGERTFGRLLRAAAHGRRQLIELFLHHQEINRLIARWAEHGREELRLQPPQHQVGVCDREGAATAITGGPRLCARGFGPHR